MGLRAGLGGEGGRAKVHAWLVHERSLEWAQRQWPLARKTRRWATDCGPSSRISRASSRASSWRREGQIDWQRKLGVWAYLQLHHVIHHGEPVYVAKGQAVLVTRGEEVPKEAQVRFIPVERLSLEQKG